jgi:hypothetical protein
MTMDRRFALALVPTSSLTACGFDSHEVRQWVLPAKRQSIDTNVDHWVPFVFSEGPLAVTPKIPPDSRSFHVVVLPQVSFGQSARRRLLDVEFDYRSKSIEELAEFELEASFTRLTAPLGSDVDADTLNRALRIAWHRPPLKGDEPVPELISVKGRKWIHFDGSAFESYGTLIDPQTVFFIFGSFWENIRKDPTWFQSRRDLLRLIRDQVVITE